MSPAPAQPAPPPAVPPPATTADPVSESPPAPLPAPVEVEVSEEAPPRQPPPAPSAYPNGFSTVEQVPVRRVEFLGLERVSEESVRRLIQTREGQSFSRTQLQDDTNELLRSRKFLVVRSDASVQDSGVVVTFELREKPLLAEIEISGNTAISDEKLLDALGFRPGQPLDEYLVNRGRDEILKTYRDAGYGYAEVTVDSAALRNDNRAVYQVNEGVVVRVRAVVFEGNQSFERGVLLPKIKTQTYLWPFRKGSYDEDQAERDALEIQRFYRSEGYLDAKVGRRVDASADRSELTVAYVIDEGQRYQVEKIELVGNQVITDAQIRAAMKLTEGAVLKADELERDQQHVLDLYGLIGHIDTTIDADYRFTDKPGVAIVRFDINESAQSNFGRITIRGNERTQDRVIRRELRMFPGEPYDTGKTKRAERRLRETGLFSKATITPLPPEDDGQREALVEVEEGQQVNILFGVGVSTDNGVLGNVEIDNRNFDLFDWPRTFEEFVTGNSFRGAGQRLRLRLEPGTELSRFRIDFTEPYLMDKPLRLDWSAYLFQREREGYDEERVGMLVGLSRRIENGWLSGWAVEGTLRIEGVDIDDVSFLAPSDVRDVRGSSTLTSARIGLVRDTTDSRLMPTEGYRLSLGYEQAGVLGGDYTYGKPSAGIVWYKTLSTDALDRKNVLALRADTAYVVGDAPVFDRYYAGGFGSIRGFGFRGVSPRKGVTDTAVGGEWILLTSAEYSFPLYGENVRGVAFLDMGTVEEGFEITDWRASVGFGLRVNVDFFGPVPLVFDFGFPIARGDDDDEQVFNFTFGASF